MAASKLEKSIGVWGLAFMKEIGHISLILFFAFMGSESGLSVSGEVKNPLVEVAKFVPGPTGLTLMISIAIIIAALSAVYFFC